MQILVYILLTLAFALPIVGAALLRIFSARLTPVTGISSAVAIFAVAIGSVLILANSNIASLQIGSLTLLLPVTNQVVQGPGALRIVPISTTPPTPEAPAAPRPLASPSRATAATRTPAATMPTLAATASATSELTATATAAPTTEPTAAPTAEPTAAPTAEPAPTEAPAADRQTYEVQPGDTLRGIAEQFNVSVEDLLQANGLTPADGDALQPGQELVIP